MNHKILRIVAALGIPLFPLGARLLPPRHNPGVFSEAAPPGAPEPPAAVPLAEAAEPERPLHGALPPAEALAGLFIPPATAAPRGTPSGDGNAGLRAEPVSAEGKFSYLGSIREDDDREWLYLKDEATGRILSVNASPAASNGERSVVAIDGVPYFFRRK
jgi:hypothetical protein